jgi:hypothetical protein
MHKNIRNVVLAASCLAGCVGGTAPGSERPAGSGQLAVTTEAGARFTGPAARIDIRIDAAGTATAQLMMTGTDSGGRTWTLVSAVPMAKLELRHVHARVVVHPLQPGDATAQLATREGAVTLASAGQLDARLQDGKIVGELIGASPDIAASFAGAFAVTCATVAADGPVPANGERALIVDDKFASEDCRPYAGLNRQL